MSESSSDSEDEPSSEEDSDGENKFKKKVEEGAKEIDFDAIWLK